jgi:RNA polymerase sigma factor (TIGR02999 family)
MREILVDRVRHRSRKKHGGDRCRENLVDDALMNTEFEQPFDDMLRLDEALRRLEAEHPQRAEIVMLRYFAGLTNEQIASFLNIATRTVERGWRFARAWLHKELGDGLREPALPDDGSRHA